MTELLEDAIRAGVARGMAEAPAVPDLAERVRALPPGQRHWKVPVAVAAAVVALVSVAVAVSIPRTGDSSPAGPTQSPSPSPTATPTATSGNNLTAFHALGVWSVVWNANYDGPPMGMLEVSHVGNDSSRFQVTLIQDCPPVKGGGHLSGTGRLLDHSIPPTPRPRCSRHGPKWLPPDPLEAAFGTVDHLVVSTDMHRLTLFAGRSPVARLVTERPVWSSWSESGQLPAAALGTWEYVGRPADTRKGTLVLTSGGKVIGSGGCNTFTGTYSIRKDGRAAFSPVKVRNHSCPAGTAPTWTPPAGLARVGLDGDRLTMYDADLTVVAAFDRVGGKGTR